MARRRYNQYLEVDGPIFDPDMKPMFMRAVHEGMEEHGEEGANVLGAAVLQRGFVRTGRFLQGIESAGKHSQKDTPGFVAITFGHKWPEPDAPTATWFERGTRKGVRLRTGGWGLRKTATLMRRMDYDDLYARRITAVLNG